MPINSKKDIKTVRPRNYLNKDFESLRQELITYSRAFYPDRIQDFSDASLGGLLTDMAAFIGDNLSFYLDHQFNELDPELAVETQNIENHIRNAGVEITGNSPAVVQLVFGIEVPAIKVGTSYQPKPSALPRILQNTICAANNGTRFQTTRDIDFSELDDNGDFVADISILSTNADGTPATLGMSRTVEAISGFTNTETFVIPNNFLPFRRISLSNEHITEIISVTDTEGNEYYKVGAHTQDTIFKGVPNPNADSSLVEYLLEIVPAPYRYTTRVSLSTRLTSLIFGGGQANSWDNDIIPDPSRFAIPLYGKKTFDRFSIDPNNLLNTRTLGVAPQGTTLTIVYRYGGGLRHNVASQTITTISTLIMDFPNNPSVELGAQVRASVGVTNFSPASGGENALTIDELRSRIPSARNSQKRIVTREDLMARIYTMPSNFGRVFRAGLGSNVNNSESSRIYIVSRDVEGKLTVSPDTLKINLVRYLNQFRMTTDSIDILDSPIINLGLEFEVVTAARSNKNLVVSNILSKLQNFFNVENFQIDQPIILSDIQNVIFNTVGVASVTRMRFRNLVGSINGRTYSNNAFNIATNTVRGMLFPPQGGIFEIRHLEYDIKGSGI